MLVNLLKCGCRYSANSWGCPVRDGSAKIQSNYLKDGATFIARCYPGRFKQPEHNSVFKKAKNASSSNRLFSRGNSSRGVWGSAADAFLIVAALIVLVAMNGVAAVTNFTVSTIWWGWRWWGWW